MASERGQHSPRSDVTLPPDQVDFTKIKTIYVDDLEALEKAGEPIKGMLKRVFGV